VLLDVGLGAEDGLEVARWMRTQPGLEQVPVIAVSAHAMVTHRAAMMRAGCNSFLAKPVDFVALQRQLRDWLGQARTAAQEQA
jgi:CheY-like chemotaxis protein